MAVLDRCFSARTGASLAQVSPRGKRSMVGHPFVDEVVRGGDATRVRRTPGNGPFHPYWGLLESPDDARPTATGSDRLDRCGWLFPPHGPRRQRHPGGIEGPPAGAYRSEDCRIRGAERQEDPGGDAV